MSPSTESGSSAYGRHQDVGGLEFADDETLGRACAGDSEALALLWRIYQPQLLRYLIAQGTGATDDVASQVWLDVERALDRFEGDGQDFRRWLFTIGRRRAIDHARTVQRRGEVVVEEYDHRIDGELEAGFDAHDHRSQIELLLSELRSDMAEVVLLRVVQDLPVADVADRTGLSEANVRTLTHRGLTVLRRRLTQAEGPACSNDEHNMRGGLPTR